MGQLWQSIEIRVERDKEKESVNGKRISPSLIPRLEKIVRLSTEIVGKNNSEASQIGGKLNIQFGGRFLDEEVSS